MNTQEMAVVFWRVHDHLLAQGRKSVNVEGLCAYRSADGTSCAIGCLIPDDKYSPSFEGWSVSCGSDIQLAAGIGGINGLFLSDLQDIHDQNPVEDWPGALEDVRVRWNIPERAL